MSNSQSPLIIAFSGKIGVGKDYLATHIFPKYLQAHLQKPLKTLYLAFADPIKELCAARYGTSFDKLYIEKDEITRKRLQEIGDELRQRYDEGYFVRWMKLQFKLHSKRSHINTFIITDVRFPEEVKLVHSLGGKVFRVKAPNRNQIKLESECKNNREMMFKRSRHRSEIALDKCDEFDGEILNEESDNVVVQCKKLIEHFF